MKFLLGAMGVVGAVIGAVAVLLYSAAFLYSGGHGIYAWGGSWWLSGCVFLFISARITLPITLGAFYCAWQVWGWHWALAALWAMPGLAVALPTLASAAIAGLIEWFHSTFPSRKQREQEELRRKYFQELFDDMNREGSTDK